MKGDGSEDRWHAVALLGRGFTLTELNRLDEAEATYREVLAKEPGNAVALNELVYIRELRKGEWRAPSRSTSSGR